MTTDPITQAREAIAALESRTSTKRGEALDLAVNLLRTLTSEGAEDALARIVEANSHLVDYPGKTARAVISHFLAAAFQKGADHG